MKPRRVFISYIHEEEGIARAIETQLKRILKKRVDVFLARSIPLGRDWFAEIRTQLNTANVILTIFSPYSCDRPWINIETGYGIMAEKTTDVIPVCCLGLLPSDLPSAYSRFNAMEVDQPENIMWLLKTLAPSWPGKERVNRERLIRNWINATEEAIESIPRGFIAEPLNPVKNIVKVRSKGAGGASADFPVELVNRNPNRRLPNDSIVKLSWPTILRGAENLRRYVVRSKVKIAACIGLNPAGFFLTSYVLKHDDRRDRLGMVPVPLKGGRRPQPSLPRREVVFEGSKLAGKILLVDSQIKTGWSGSRAFDLLKKTYECSSRDIWHVVLVACGVDESVIAGANKRRRAPSVRNGTGRPPLPLKTVLDCRDKRTWGSGVKHVPARVVYFTPDRVEMPQGLF